MGETSQTRDERAGDQLGVHEDVCTRAGSACTRVCLCARGVDVVAVPLLERPAWAVDGHQQVQGDGHRVHGEHLLSISHNRRHPKKFAGLSLKET